MGFRQAHIEWIGRAVMLLDLDAFFASVEQLDHPAWRGKPVIVGGSADKRGVVSTCSYEARAFGVRSAMPAKAAAKLCPDAIWVPGNFHRYREMSARVMAIMRDESPLLQQVSIDEAFLDVSPTRFIKNDPVEIAQRIQERVKELGITCSIGLGISKSVAKVASDMDKPQGLTVVYPGRERDFLAPLPTKVMSGIGPVAQEQLRKEGIATLGQVAEVDDYILNRIFGKNAQMMRLRCLGADTDPVEDNDPAKSVSNEISFAENLTSRADIEAALATVSAKVARRLRMAGLKASGMAIKIRFEDLTARTTSCMLSQPNDDEYVFMAHSNVLIDELWHEGTPVRLVGLSAYRFENEEGTQLSLFDDEDSLDVPPESIRTGLIQATDSVRNRFGEHAVAFGREIRTRANLTGSSSKNPSDYKASYRQDENATPDSSK